MTTAQIFDLATLILALIVIIRGWHNGLLASFFGLVGTAACGIAAILFSEPAAVWFYDRFIRQFLEQAVGQNTAQVSEQVIEVYRGSAGSALEQFGYDISGAASQIQEQLHSGLAGASQTIMNTAVEPLVQTLVRVVCFVLLFALFGLVLKLVLWIFQRFNDVPVLGFVNRFLGLTLGAAEAVLLVYILSVALVALAGLGDWKYLNPRIMHETWIISRAAGWNLLPFLSA